MKVLRQTGAYLVALFLVLATVFAIVHFGGSLPSRTRHAVAALHPPDAIAQLSVTEALQKSLEANSHDPFRLLLIQLLAVFGTCRLLAKLIVYVGLPAVVGEILAGIALGPSLFGLIAPTLFRRVFPPQSLGALHLLGDLGSCFFMFTAGQGCPNVASLRERNHLM